MPMSLLGAFRWLGIIVAAVVGGMISTHPEDVESNAAAWLEFLGLASWAENFTPATDDLILGASIAIAVLLLATPCFSRVTDASAAKRNPGNGWRVSRLIMKAWTLRKVEALCQDFLAQPHRTDEVLVLAARSIRQHRSKGGTTDASWRFWGDLEEAMEQHGVDPVSTAIADLDAAFPPSWPMRCWMNYRQWREKRQPSSPKTHVLRPSFSGTAQSKLTASLEYNPAPAPPWSKPLSRLYWIWRKKIRRLIRRSA